MLVFMSIKVAQPAAGRAAALDHIDEACGLTRLTLSRVACAIRGTNRTPKLLSTDDTYESIVESC